MRILWYLGLTLLAIPLFLTACSGCASHLAHVIVKAPNQGKSIEELDTMPSAARLGREPEQSFRVTVGPPEASLAVRVLDPAETPMLGLKIEPKDAVSYSFHLVYAADGEVVENVNPDEPRGTVLVLHGLFGNKDTLPALWARMLAGAGYRTVLVDLRGHGQSTGDWLTYGVVESRDLSQVLDELYRRNLVTGRVGVLGISYGAATGIQLSARDPRIDAVVAIAPFASMRQVVPDFGRGVLGPLGWLIPPPLVDAAIDYTEQYTGVSPELSNTVNAMAASGAPVLLVHGDRDKHVPVSHSQQLYTAGHGLSRLWVMERETHMTLAARPQLSLKEVRNEAIDWFDHWLEPIPQTPVADAVEPVDGDPVQMRVE